MAIFLMSADNIIQSTNNDLEKDNKYAAILTYPHLVLCDAGIEVIFVLF